MNNINRIINVYIKKKKVFKKITISYFFLSFVLLLLVFFIASFIIIKDKLGKVDKSLSYVYTLNSEKIEIDYASLSPKIEEVYEYTNCSLGLNELVFVTDFGKKTVNGNITCYSLDYNNKIFPTYNEMEYSINNNQEMIYGQYPKEKNDILIDEITVLKMGLNANDILNNKISIFLPNNIIIHANEKIYSNLLITGVIKKEYLSLSSNLDIEGLIILSNDLEKKEYIQKINYMNFYFDEAMDYNEIIDELTETQGYSFFYANIDKVIITSMIEKYIGIITYVLSILIIIILILSLFSMINCGSEFIRKEKKVLFIMYSYGLKESDEKLIIFYCFIKKFLKAFLLTLFVSIPILFIASEIISNTLFDFFRLTFLNYLSVYVITFIVDLIVVMISSLICLVFNKKNFKIKYIH